MMEVAVESPQPAWDQFKEEVEIMEEDGGGAAAAAAGELLTREIKKRLLDHAHENGNGAHVNGGGEEELKVLEEPKVTQEEQQHKSIFFDAAKGLWKCRHCDWTYLLASPCGNGAVDHRGYRHQIERNLESLVEGGSFYGSPNKVPDIITEVSARYLVTGVMRSGAEKEDANETPSPKGKELEAHENGSAQEIDHSPCNGKLENGLHSNGSHQVSNGAEHKIEYMFENNKTEIFPTEVDNGEHVTEAQPKVEEYDLEKILDQQETHDLFCPNCKSCITRRVILKKRKRTVRPATPDQPSKRPYTEGVPLPSATSPGSNEQKSPNVFRCFSCFSFFIPTGCSFNIFRIFRRRDVDQDVLPPPASEDMPQSENCTSWLLSCFQPGDSPNQPAPADPATMPLLSSTQSPNDTTRTTTTEQDTSFFHHSHGRVAKPEQSTVESSSENQAAADPATMPLQSETQIPNDTTTTTESSTYVYHSHGTVVKPEHSTVESSSEHQTTTTTTTTAIATSSSTTTSGAANTSSHTSSATGTFSTNVITGEMPTPEPAVGAIMGATHHLLGQEDVHGTATTTFQKGSFSTHESHTSEVKVNSPHVTNIPRGDIPALPNPQAADPPHVALSVPEDVNPAPPRPQQRDDWDILKAIVYGGLVESVTSLSVVSAAASSGAKTLDIFILGIANLIGGLPLIFHNIADLRDIRDVNEDNERIGHYWLQLGRRSKARLHMVLVLLSYIVFGLLPPVIYGLSFRESNNREHKMMAVAGASLSCIELLALGKAHVHRRPRTYFKTLVYYLTIAVSSSGLSYVAGMLITRLLEHYGVFEQGGASARPVPPGLFFSHAVGAQTSAWASF